eukprot:CAMPEP_0116042232 /NCGR_PEP_ID=MMETSP0321-20121206/25555_1 /TAXON_ID=163516 /ORGANISM="Leptocylindrus danicus var. danicus, Strain B650" /LENGTH=107 /DNA_ID=CAMNT_0003522645 /DNA_START=142 /DNA_END=465 /DNA_ORIENTATION=+
MNQFIQRIANYIANEILIKGLAESRTFQRVALRTHNTIQDMKKGGIENINSKLDDVHKAASEAAYYSTSTKSKAATKGPPTPPQSGFAGFVSAFGKEIRKDLGIGGK